MSQVSVLTPSFPRYEGDYHGSFIKSLCDELANDVDIRVIAPRSRTMGEVTLSYPVKRFAYMPNSRMEYIAEGTIKNAPRNVLVELPFYLLSAYTNTILSKSNLIHTHLAIPLGLVGTNNPKKTPHIITCHGSDITYPVDKSVYKPFLRHVLRKADYIVAVSNFIKKQAIHIGANPDKIETVYLGVDVDKFKLVAKNNDIPVIGTLARLVPEKNIEEILHAAKLLQRFIDFRLKIGGDGPELVNLKRISNRLGVKAEFTGRVTDPVSFHQSLDVFILASNREGLSISLQEAMSCGTVPVTVKGNGCIELVRDGYNGFLYESGNLNMLVDKIIEAVEDRDMFQRARKTIVKKFDNKITSKRYLQLYSDLGIFFKR